MTWWDVRCELPDAGYRTGDCHGLLFRMSDRGLEVKCHRCHRIQIIPMARLDRYRMPALVST